MTEGTLAGTLAAQRSATLGGPGSQLSRAYLKGPILDFVIRDATPADHPAVLELNRAFEHFTSPLGAPDILRLSANASLFRVAETDEGIAAFLLAFGPGLDYDSVNYVWFNVQTTSFLYIDRVVVSTYLQRGGLGAALYRDAFAHARAKGFERVVCEVDIEPLNTTSLAFHERLGFAEVGTQWVHGGTKRVSLRECGISSSQQGAAG